MIDLMARCVARQWIWTALLAGLFAFGRPAGAQEDVALSLQEARVLATQALHAGRADLARDLAMGLLQADPEDAFAYSVLATAHSQLDNPRLARSAARLAFRYGPTAQDKFLAAHLAGRLAAVQDRPTAAQIWLRRAAIHAETEQQDTILGRDYKAVRAYNPWNLRLRFDVTPSNNVNSGADSTQQFENGVPVQGRIGGRSLALSGVVASYDAELSYRLAHSKTYATSLGARLYTRQVELSSEARDTAPDARNSDYETSYADISLRHGWRMGAPGNTAAAKLTFGAAWSAREHNYNLLRLDLTRGVKLSEKDRLTLRFSTDWRNSAIASVRDAKAFRIGTTYAHEYASGNSFALSLDLQDVQSDVQNGSYQTANLRLTYALGRKLGPAEVRASLVYGYSDYDTYRTIGLVPGGRQDDSVFADVDFVFADYDYAGFAPSVTLRAGRRASNISRFEMEELSLGLSLRSKF